MTVNNIDQDNNNQANQENNQNKLDLRPNSHSFDTDLASKYGIEIAIMLKHINYLVNLNMKMKRNFHEDRYWFYNTLDEIAAHFEYWSHKQIERLLKKMCDMKLILKGNFNKSSYDRTCWYTLNCQMHFPKSGNGKDEIGKCIKGTNTNTNTNKEINKESGGGCKKDMSEVKTSLASKDAHDLFNFFENKFNENRKSLNEKPIKLESTKSQLKGMEYLVNSYGKDKVKKVLTYGLEDDFWKQVLSTPLKLKKNFISIEMQMLNKKVNSIANTEVNNRIKCQDFYEKYKNNIKGVRLELLHNSLEFIYTASSAQPIIINFNSRDFNSDFDIVKRKFNLK